MTAAYLPGVGNRLADPQEAVAVHAARAAARAATSNARAVVKPGELDLSQRPGALPSAPLLTPRMRDVLHLIAAGHSNADIAVALHLSEDTVKSHARRLIDRLGVRNRAQAVDHAHRIGLLP